MCAAVLTDSGLARPCSSSRNISPRPANQYYINLRLTASLSSLLPAKLLCWCVYLSIKKKKMPSTLCILWLTLALVKVQRVISLACLVRPSVIHRLCKTPADVRLGSVPTKEFSELIPQSRITICTCRNWLPALLARKKMKSPY